MATIGDRLKAERVRLKYSQEAFGDAVGVGKHSQIRYEKGERSPDGDYLLKAHGLGADVAYIITGFHAPWGNSVEDEREAYLTPARRLAGEIELMGLAEGDAELILAMARRLNKAG